MRRPLVATLLAVAASAAIAIAMLVTLPAADLTLAHDPELVLLSPRAAIIAARARPAWSRSRARPG